MFSILKFLIISFVSSLLLCVNTSQAQSVEIWLWQQQYDRYFSDCMSSGLGINSAQLYNKEHPNFLPATAKTYCIVYAREKTPSPVALYQIALDRCVNELLENMRFSVMEFGAAAIKPELIEICERSLVDSISDNQR